jgi:hypothetical protein
MYYEVPAGWTCDICKKQVNFTKDLPPEVIPTHVQLGQLIIGTVCKGRCTKALIIHIKGIFDEGAAKEVSKRRITIPPKAG